MYLAVDFAIKKTYDVKCLVLLLKVSKLYALWNLEGKSDEYYIGPVSVSKLCKLLPNILPKYFVSCYRWASRVEEHG